MGFLDENLSFFREFIREFQSTGAILPSSRFAAQALVKKLRQREKPFRILEVGPGSGSVTIEILKTLGEKDTFDICELNPRLLECLQKKLSSNPDFNNNKQRISFFNCPVQELDDSNPYDYIVCTIPFLNLPKNIVEEIFEKLISLSHSETILTYYEYIGLRSLGKITPIPDRQKRFHEIDGFFSELNQKHNVERERVWLNVTPINVYVLRPASA